MFRILDAETSIYSGCMHGFAQASAVGPPGSSFARPLSRQMSDAYTTLKLGTLRQGVLRSKVGLYTNMFRVF